MEQITVQHKTSGKSGILLKKFKQNGKWMYRVLYAGRNVAVVGLAKNFDIEKSGKAAEGDHIVDVNKKIFIHRKHHANERDPIRFEDCGNYPVCLDYASRKDVLINCSACPGAEIKEAGRAPPL